MPQTLYDKLWQRHCIGAVDGEYLLYIDRHLIHEVTSPQAFASLDAAGRKVRCPEKTIATMDHSISTRSLALDACGSANQIQLQTLVDNCRRHNILLYPVGDPQQGIVHVMAPEQGLILPGMTVVCGDSHTSTHGALGALAFGIGTSEVEHVLATQTLRQSKARNMRVRFNGQLRPGVSAKDLILYLIRQIGTAGANGYVIEFSGSAVSSMPMEQRMTLCNMSIEAGAKAGLIAPDTITFTYLTGRRYAPKDELWQHALADWQQLNSDDDALFDQELLFDVSELRPQVSWGINPAQVISVDEAIPEQPESASASEQKLHQQALDYMQVKAGTPITTIPLSHVFIGSCTNGRLSDLREAAAIARRGKVASSITAIVVPGSMQVKRQAEAEGLDEIFIKAGFQWRLPGCSMCLGMNDDNLSPEQRCASTSNRNFIGRQGRGAFTHLVSPAMAAAAALAGHFVDVSAEEALG